MPLKRDADDISAKIENEGFDYWADNYASSDVSGDLSDKLSDYLKAKAAFIEALEDEGVEIDEDL